MNPTENKPNQNDSPQPTQDNSESKSSDTTNTSKNTPGIPPLSQTDTLQQLLSNPINSINEPPVNSPSIPPVTPQSNSLPNKKHNLRKIIFVLFIIILIAIIISVALQISSKNQPDVTLTKHNVSLLRVGTEQPFPSSFYPNMSTDSFSQEINNQAFEGLTRFTNQTQIVPDLAVSWTNPNNTTWIFKIRQGVKFHDGQTLTANQVIASLNQVSKYPIYQVAQPAIQSVTATDPYTVQIKTSQPDPLLDRQLSELWIWDTNDTKTPNNTINGTGPFVLKPGTSLTSSSVQFVAYDGYHGGKSTVNELDFSLYPNTQKLLSDVQQNKMDIADLTYAPNFKLQATKDKLPLFNIVDPLVYYIVPNTLKPGSPLQNLKVRQAIYMTLNPSLLAKAHYGNGGSIIVANQLVPQQIPGYNPNIKRPAIDINEAKALLAQAGYPNGFSLSFMFYAPNAAVGTELQKELSQIGIKITLDPESDLNVLGSKEESGAVDLYFIGDASTLLDTSDVASSFVIDSPEYSNPQVDALYNQAQQMTNQSNRLLLLQQLNAKVMSDLATFPLYIPTSQYLAYRPGLVLNQQWIGGYTGIAYWQVYSTK